MPSWCHHTIFLVILPVCLSGCQLTTVALAFLAWIFGLPISKAAFSAGPPSDSSPRRSSPFPVANSVPKTRCPLPFRLCPTPFCGRTSSLPRNRMPRLNVIPLTPWSHPGPNSLPVRPTSDKDFIRSGVPAGPTWHRQMLAELTSCAGFTRNPSSLRQNIAHLHCPLSCHLEKLPFPPLTDLDR